MKLSQESIPSRINIPGEGKLVLAFSGGEDSLFLLIMLSVLAPSRTTALYINHNLRSEDEIEKEIALNRENAGKLGIPFHVITIPRGLIEKEAAERNIGIEAAARDIRYKSLIDFASGNGSGYILTAHHLDDQAETLIMRMMEHSPFWKWGGIRERDSLVVRPMLEIRKDEIRAVVRESGLRHSTDSTNEDTSFKRNYIRKNILPLITDEEKILISRIAHNVALLPQREISFSVSTPLFVSFSRKEYLISGMRERENTLFSLFSVLGEKERLSRRFLSEVDALIEKGEKRLECTSYILYAEKDFIKAYRKLDDFEAGFNGEETVLPGGLAVSYSRVDFLSLEIPEDVLSSSILRKSRSGDTIFLIDGKRKISSLLKEMKIPYAIVLEKDGEISAFFSSFLGGRDRISGALRGREGRRVNIVSPVHDGEVG